METELGNQIYTKLNKIENEIEEIKVLVTLNKTSKRKNLVSLKGMAKLLVSEKELDKTIEESKKSLFKGASYALRS